MSLNREGERKKRIFGKMIKDLELLASISLSYSL